MTDADPAPSAALPIAEALGQTRRQLAALDELTGHGLAVSRAIAEQASGERAEPVVSGDIALAYARVARAVHQAVLLQQKLIKDLSEGAEARAASEPEDDEDDAPLTPEDTRKDRVARIVQRLAVDRCADEDALQNLMIDACEQLEDDDLYGDVMERPLSELVARLCKDLGLEPDWSALSQELWAQREIASGEVGAPLAAEWILDQTRPPPLAGEGDPEGVERAFSRANGGDSRPLRSP